MYSWSTSNWCNMKDKKVLETSSTRSPVGKLERSMGGRPGRSEMMSTTLLWSSLGRLSIETKQTQGDTRHWGFPLKLETVLGHDLNLET